MPSPYPTVGCWIARRNGWKRVSSISMLSSLCQEKINTRSFPICRKLTAKTERERKIVTMFRNFSLTGSPFILPPAMPKDRVEIIKEALRKSFKDPAFFQEYHKLVGDD